MSATLDISEADILKTLRGVLITMLPAGTEVLRTEINRVPEPLGPNFVMMTPMGRTRLSTNHEAYTDPVADGGTGAGSRTVMTPTQVSVQLDVYGPNSANLTQIMLTLLRDDFACRAFDDAGLPVQLLYADDANQAPFINGEMQYEFRWTFDVHLQTNATVTVGQDFADTVTIGVISVDVEYPP